MDRPTIIAVGGFTSEVGKTTVMCDLLAAFPGWEAIKTTRGHYRSCGKEPQACCVSHLLTEQPVIHSGHAETYSAGKDTGRYWDAGASNVHWLIVTEEQVEEGIKRVMERVAAPGVFVEGNSFTEFVPIDFFLMVARAAGEKIKTSARRALPRVSALYLSEQIESPPLNSDGPRTAKVTSGDESGSAGTARERFGAWRERKRPAGLRSDVPIYTRGQLPQLVAALQHVHQAAAAERASDVEYQISGLRC